MKDTPHGQAGTFRNLPGMEESRNAEHNPEGLFNFRFEVGSCANQNPLHGIGHQLPVYENLNRSWADKVHFHIMNGDWLYEELARRGSGIGGRSFVISERGHGMTIWAGQIR